MNNSKAATGDSARKVFVKDDGVAQITCHHCHLIKKISVTAFKGKNQRRLRIKCTCGRTFTIELEHRRHFRHPVKICGEFINLSHARQYSEILIKNLSLGGIGFINYGPDSPQPGDRLEVRFALGDTKKKEIRLEAIVKAARTDYFGCEFINIEAYRSELGFYLL